MAEPEDLRPVLRRLQSANYASVFDRYTMPPSLVAISIGLEVPISQVAAAASAYFLAYGLMQPLWGLVSERLGLARTMRWAALAGSGATAASMFAQGSASLIVTRVLAGAFFGAIVPTSLIYAGGAFPSASRQRGLTTLMKGNALGTAMSTLVAGGVVAVLGWRWVFALSMAVGFTACAFLTRLPEAPRPPRRGSVLAPIRRVLGNRAALALFALVFLEGGAIMGCLTFVPAAIESAGGGTVLASSTITLFGVGVLVLAGVVGRLSRRRSASRLIAIGAGSGALACALMAASPTLAAAFLCCALLGAAWAFSHSSLQTWATQVAPAERSTAVSFFAASLFAGNAASAASGGHLLGTGHLWLQFAGCACVLVIVGVVGAVARARWERAG